MHKAIPGRAFQQGRELILRGQVAAIHKRSTRSRGPDIRPAHASNLLEEIIAVLGRGGYGIVHGEVEVSGVAEARQVAEIGTWCVQDGCNHLVRKCIFKVFWKRMCRCRKLLKGCMLKSV